MTKIKNLVDIVIDEENIVIQTKVNNVWVLYEVSCKDFVEYLEGHGYINTSCPDYIKVLENGSHEFLHLGLYLESNQDLLLDYLKENGVEII